MKQLIHATSREDLKARARQYIDSGKPFVVVSMTRPSRVEIVTTADLDELACEVLADVAEEALKFLQEFGA